MKGCDIGYALAAGSCEGVNRVDACTVTAFDVIAAFATSGPNLPLAKPVGFFGSERPANYFALAITQPTSDRQRFIETNPFDRRRKPDIGMLQPPAPARELTTWTHVPSQPAM